MASQLPGVFLCVSLPRRRQRHESENVPSTRAPRPGPPSRGRDPAPVCCHENMFLVCPRVRDWTTPEDARIPTQMQLLLSGPSVCTSVEDAMLWGERRVTDITHSAVCHISGNSQITDYGLTPYLSSFKPLMVRTVSDVYRRDMNPCKAGN